MKNFLVIIFSSILVLSLTGVSLATNQEEDLENSISYNIEKGVISQNTDMYLIQEEN